MNTRKIRDVLASVRALARELPRETTAHVDPLFRALDLPSASRIVRTVTRAVDTLESVLPSAAGTWTVYGSHDPVLERARQVLGVTAGATEETVRAAYRACVRAMHPDTRTSETPGTLQGLKDARDVLLRKAT